MMIGRDRAKLAIIGIAFCVPLQSAGQNTQSSLPRSPATQQSSLAVPELPLDTAKRLDGRLFFSAQQRQRMDDARKRGLIVGADSQLVEPPPSVLNGFVKRSDGNTAIWVDGVPRWNAHDKNAMTLMPTDVGGPAAYVKVASGEELVSPAARTAHAKRPAKPRAKKVLKRRPLR